MRILMTADAVGEPGQRTFYLQAASGADQVTLLVEKEQVRRLAESLGITPWKPALTPILGPCQPFERPTR